MAAAQDIVDILDIRDALRELIVGNHTFTSTVRQDAQRAVRDAVEDRITAGRRKAGDPLPALLYSIPVIESEMFLGGPGECADSNVRFRVLAENDREKIQIADAMRQMLDGLAGVSVTTRDGSLFIGVIVLTEHGDIEPEDPIDASDNWRFGYELLFHIGHQVKVPSGVT